MSTPAHPLQLRLDQITREADNVISLRFSDPAGVPLPAWQAGAHLELQLPSGRLRHYSLCGDTGDRFSYRVGVLRDVQGRGGSEEIHTQLRVGQCYPSSVPRNHFALQPAPHYLFIAGGIGITPLLPMIDAVAASADWRLVYAGRNRQSMAFTTELARRPWQIRLHADDEHGRLDIAQLLDSCSADTLVYCCGPGGLIDAVDQACAERGLTFICERFGARQKPVAPSSQSPQCFEVVLARSNCSVQVAEGQSVLAAVREKVPDVPFSCESGFCGACETRVLEGDVEHLDSLLSDAEKASNRSMMICVSRACCPRLVLDL
ncbi:PDR/VanB family oxidoreductase [Pseudomonas sediminis]|uniref:PDR/VanB family oxidoreductase n=1 Tax=Pseudomonas sediminis TaxID=1691904 RepID=UPI00244B5876|nr:PDR/VanB family oxidoreductase [Pseudomonas sediminis]MDG9759564.1 PDR/VanB family oxidoreductase [Pseudomonas sediminis]